MPKLIRAGFFRYFHSTVFWVCGGLSAVLAFLFGYRLCRNVCLDEHWFFFATVVFAVLLSLSVGGEVSGTAKNKIVKGYSRTQIFFSEWLVACAIVSIFFVLYLVMAFLLNTAILSHTPLSLTVQCIVGFYSIALTLTTVYLSLVCMIAKKTVAVIVCFVLSFGVYFTSFTVADRLNNREFNKVGTLGENGEWEFSLEKNPEYVEEPVRSVLSFYLNVNPYGQRSVYEDIVYPYLFRDGAWEAALEATANTTGNEHLLREISPEEQRFLDLAPLYTVAPIPLFVLAGWLSFRKKELK